MTRDERDQDKVFWGLVATVALTAAAGLWMPYNSGNYADAWPLGIAATACLVLIL